MNHLNYVFEKFEPISLEEMDRVRLLDRVDKKYMFTAQTLPSLLAQLTKDYFVLEIDNNRYSNYETLYYDTPHFDLYLKHHNGKLNRYKFRFRRYVESNLYFFEVKFKNNQGRTKKKRIRREGIPSILDSHSKEFLEKNSGLNSADFLAKLWVCYSRITLVSKLSHERLTLDTNLVFKNGDNQKSIDDLVIAEVKQDSAAASSVFISLMKKMQVREKSISKYCLGVISLFPAVKKNNFKPSLLYLTKLLNHDRPLFQL